MFDRVFNTSQRMVMKSSTNIANRPEQTLDESQCQEYAAGKIAIRRWKKRCFCFFPNPEYG